MKTIILATQNRHKLDEIEKILEGQFEVKGIDFLQLSHELPETGKTLEANSQQKAEFIHRLVGGYIASDDSGLEVEALGGRPGVDSALFAGKQKNNVHNYQMLLNLLHCEPNRAAAFRTVITLIEPDGQSFTFEGRVAGTITKVPMGTNGFGYDPVFIPDGFNKTFAQMTDAEKNAISHRALAVAQLKAHLMAKK